MLLMPNGWVDVFTVCRLEFVSFSSSLTNLLLAILHVAITGIDFGHEGLPGVDIFCESGSKSIEGIFGNEKTSHMKSLNTISRWSRICHYGIGKKRFPKVPGTI
jgi:hypothetical protein